MISIEFYMKVHDLKKKLMGGERIDSRYVFDRFEEYRSKKPVIYNIETTNICNMRCIMCARTSKMTREPQTLDMDTYKRVVDQLEPFSQSLLGEWDNFLEKEYGILKTDMNESHFFLHAIGKSIVMHGFGAPLLDKNIAERIKMLTDRGIQSYFSCNPVNINVDKMIELFEKGLDYLKFSIESVDNKRQKEVRGDFSDFAKNYKKIVKLLDEKKKHNYKTTIVITMLDLKAPDQKEQFEKLRKAFEGRDVYIFFKSVDNQWYRNTNYQNKSVHWSEFCQAPWSTLSVQANGEVSACGAEDYNNELIMGDVKRESLYDIWNNRKFQKFREDHFALMPKIKCSEHCDIQLIGKFVNTLTDGEVANNLLARKKRI